MTIKAQPHHRKVVEHKLLNTVDSKKMEGWLDEYVNQGWEIVTLTTTPIDSDDWWALFTALLRREKPPT